MGKSGKPGKPSFIADEGGQAIIEYVLMLTVVVSVVSIIGIGFRKSLLALWGSFTRDISAACPGCPADPRYKLR